MFSPPIEFGAIDNVCGNVGDSMTLSANVQTQFLPEQAEVTWYKLDGSQVNHGARPSVYLRKN